MNPITLNINIDPAFTTAVSQLASALSGKVEQTTLTNIIPMPAQDTARNEPSIEEEVPKPRRAKKEAPPAPKVDLNKVLEDLCNKARDLIKSGKVQAAQVKAIAVELGAAKLSELEATEENLDKAAALLDALTSEEDV